MRGASFLVAVIFVAEIGDMRRFDTPRQLMSFLGLVPAESSRRLPGFGVSLYATTLRLFCSWSWK
jgi:transposase